jgi:hypothetical protein
MTDIPTVQMAEWLWQCLRLAKEQNDAGAMILFGARLKAVLSDPRFPKQKVA